MKWITIYDNKWESADRFTIVEHNLIIEDWIVIEQSIDDDSFEKCLHFSTNPTSPQWICVHDECIRWNHLWEVISIQELRYLMDSNNDFYKIVDEFRSEYEYYKEKIELEEMIDEWLENNI